MKVRTTASVAIAVAVTLAAACPVALAAAPRAARPRRRPDLVERIAGLPPAHVAQGAAFRVADRVRNRGGALAGRSRTRWYLRAGRLRLLTGGRRVPRLRPGRASRGRALLRVPGAARPGTYALVVCADATRRVPESRERNNCRRARRRIAVVAGAPAPSPGATPSPTPAPVVDSDGDGSPDAVDCAPHDPAIHPGAPDAPDLRFVDSDCDGIDGDAAHAIFVSPIGDDAAAGTRASPKRTFAAAVAAAAAVDKDVYATLGTYTEELALHDGVSVYGGYDTAWRRSASNVTRIAGATTNGGDSEGAVAIGISSPTTLQLVTLAPGAPAVAGGNSYGLRGAESGGLRLERVTVFAAPGAAGASGADGLPGAPGGNGHGGDEPMPDTSQGGGSPVGHSGGEGGGGGTCVDDTRCAYGQDGAPGLATTPDAWGLMGGPGGTGGAGDSTHTTGGRGYDGDSGRFLGDGAGGGSANTGTPGRWRSARGEPGRSGSPGHGGGGGGGGGAQGCSLFCDTGGNGGGGGGGGAGGGGGSGGQGGGGSFGVFLVDSAGCLVADSTVAAADGGAGGRGGGGALGGAGGTGAAGGANDGTDASPGGGGGNGGRGGRGGDGGGGAGGPSVAIFGLPPSDAPGTIALHGAGGAGGMGGSGAGNGGGAGVAGLAANFAG